MNIATLRILPVVSFKQIPPPYTSLGSSPPGTCVPSLEQKQFGRVQVFVSHLEARSASSMIGAGAKTIMTKTI